MSDPSPTPQPVTLRYRNHRGETALRRVLPLRLWYGATAWHPEPQWLLDAVDTERGVERSFALRDVLAWDVEEGG
jgi:predicted DNA-binding transcriptional regulator YafY